MREGERTCMRTALIVTNFNCTVQVNVGARNTQTEDGATSASGGESVERFPPLCWRRRLRQRRTRRATTNTTTAKTAAPATTVATVIGEEKENVSAKLPSSLAPPDASSILDRSATPLDTLT